MITNPGTECNPQKRSANFKRKGMACFSLNRNVNIHFLYVLYYVQQYIDVLAIRLLTTNRNHMHTNTCKHINAITHAHIPARTHTRTHTRTLYIIIIIINSIQLMFRITCVFMNVSLCQSRGAWGPFH